MAKIRKSRPDTPLAPTPDTISDANNSLMNRVRNESARKSIEGSALRAIELKKNREATDAAQKSLRDKKNDDALNQISKDSQSYDNAKKA